MSRQRGFSLLEALFTALLISLALGIVGVTAHQFQRVMARSDAADRGLEAQLALRRVAAELEEATRIVSPALSVSSSSLRFERLDPNYPGRIPGVLLPEPDPIPAAWEPRDPAYLVMVSYSLNGSQRLLRRAVFPGGAFEEQQVADSLLGFQATHPQRGVLSLRATVERGTRSLTVNLHAAPSELAP